MTLRFTLPHSARVSLAIFDGAGRRIREVTSGVVSQGEHAFTWDLRDESGRASGAGVYLARLEVEDAWSRGSSRNSSEGRGLGLESLARLR